MKQDMEKSLAIRRSAPGLPVLSRRLLPVRCGALSALVATMLAGFFVAPPLAAQADCLRILVVDPSGAAVPNATVSIGAMEQPTDATGAAVFCGLGTGSHSVVVTALGLAAAERTVAEAVGAVTRVISCPCIRERYDGL